jgi:putative addiction module component (TIGR02574 family)
MRWDDHRSITRNYFPAGRFDIGDRWMQTLHMASPREAAQRILAEALALPEGERANVAAELLASLASDESVGDEEWMAELERRADRFRRGEQKGIPWNQVQTKILAELR